MIELMRARASVLKEIRDYEKVVSFMATFDFGQMPMLPGVASGIQRSAQETLLNLRLRLKDFECVIDKQRLKAAYQIALFDNFDCSIGEDEIPF